MSQDLSTSRLDRVQLARIADSLKAKQSIDSIADDLGIESSQVLLAGIAASLRLPLVDLTEVEVNESLFEKFPIRLVHRHEFFPISQSRDGLVVAVSNPFDFQAIDTLSAATEQIIQPVVAPPEQVRELIRRYLGVGAETIDGLMALRKDDDEYQEIRSLSGKDLEDAEVAQQASVIRLVNEILGEAIEARASDIHIEAQESGIKIRYRVDGVLQRQPAPPEMNQFQAAIISRLKTLS